MYSILSKHNIKFKLQNEGKASLSLSLSLFPFCQARHYGKVDLDTYISGKILLKKK